MAYQRKTIDVEELKVLINKRLADKSTTPEQRRELAALLTHTLHKTGNYKGFNYLDWMEGGFERWRRDGEPMDTAPYLGDLTRVVFF